MNEWYELADLLRRTESVELLLNSTRFNSLIYRFHDRLNDKNYIGLTSNLPARLYSDLFGHVTRILSGEYSRLYKSIRLHGVENFEFRIEELCSKEDLNDREKFYISYYDSFYNGYNATLGGGGGNGLIPITNGVINKRIKPGEPIPDGFYRGGLRPDLKGRVMVTDGEHLLRIPQDSLCDYLEAGYSTEIGSLMDFSSGMRFYHKEVSPGKYETLRVPKSEGDYLISQGYIRGKSPDEKKSYQGFVVVNDSKKDYRIKKDELEYYLSLGYHKGGVSNPNRAASLGKIYIRKGEDCRLIYPENLPEWESKGYVKGRFIKNPAKTHVVLAPSKNKGKIFITNEIENLLIDPIDLDRYISNGYRKGFIRKKKRNKE